jgi:glycosyltransferase involved in cell wall biosynthesis
MAGNGISFIVRIRNEEAILGQSIRSLAGITILHEIILILHRCTDGSAQIAARLASENPNIRILTYDMDISRPGYETLATDANSKHSLVTYYNWWSQQAKYTWVFKWDADFVASDKLIHFMNSNIWEKRDMNLSMVAKNSTSSNREYYLSGGSRTFVKHLFWEKPQFSPDVVDIHLSDDLCIEHVSELSNLKSYWNEPPWYLTEISEEATIVKGRIERLTADFGPESRGMARAGNPECDIAVKAIASAHPSYVSMSS